MQLAEKQPIAIEWGFLGLFVLYVSIFVGIAEIGQGFMPAFREFTATAITAFWGFFSIPIACSGTQLTFIGFPMEIVLECTALHYMIIFVAGVLAFRSHSLSYRAAGIIIGTLAIFFFNLIRIGVIGFIGRYFTNLFTFVHDYLWQGLFALLVLLLWIIWVNGKKVFSRRMIVPFLLVSVSASLSFWLVVTFLEAYVSLLAALSNVMFPMLSLFVDVPQQVIAEGRLIGYVVGNNV
ncbi:MAG: archaeosortase/exosortase family protein, partial [Nitrospirota bacterium]|nr:archaeosortase/exosortase family protein [Nitrospirota bacterium]